MRAERERMLPEILDRHDPIQEVPADKWEKGLPLGNGKIGVMAWGGGALPLVFSLDQAEIWDARAYTPPEGKSFQAYKDLIRAGRGDETAGFTRDDGKPYVTRVPFGRLELAPKGLFRACQARLRLRQARLEGRAETDAGAVEYELFVCATREVVCLRVRYEGGESLTPRWKMITRAGDYTEADSEAATAFPRMRGAGRIGARCRDWGYPAPAWAEGDAGYYSQIIPESGSFGAAWRVRRGAACEEWYISLRADHESDNARLAAASDAEAALTVGFDALRREHEAWWADFYPASLISLPDTRLEGYYYLQTYLLGCCTRPGGVHMTIQGPWTDDNNLPPICQNDYHWNNEQQMQVWSVCTANRPEYEEPMFDLIEQNMDSLRAASRFHFGADGAFLAHCTDHLLRPTYMNVDNYEFNGMPWVCFHYWKHYKWTMNRAFLEKRAYPVMKLAAAPLLRELAEGSDGYLHLPCTSSPEYHGENETRRWLLGEGPDWQNRFGPDATIDLALTRWLLGALCEASEILNADPDARELWRKTRDKIAPYAKDEFGGLAVRWDVNLVSSHRHMSHLFPFYPLGEYTFSHNPELFRKCLDVLGLNGRGEWVGWTFPWAAILYARGGRSAAARNLLLDYIDRYVTETGMHYQGPQGACDVSLYGDEMGLFGLTIEAQLGFPEAVHELLVRCEDGAARLFVDCPPAWGDAMVSGLRLEGAFLVDAAREMGRTRFVRVYAEAGGTLRIITDLGEGEPHGALYEDGRYAVTLGKGESALIYRGDRPDTTLAPIPGREGENHYWGVKRARRF